MEEQIKKTAARVRTTFAYFWMLPILLVLLGETGGGLVGMYAGDVRATYMAETVTILLAASCVPIALKDVYKRQVSLYIIGEGGK